MDTCSNSNSFFFLRNIFFGILVEIIDVLDTSALRLIWHKLRYNKVSPFFQLRQGRFDSGLLFPAYIRALP